MLEKYNIIVKDRFFRKMNNSLFYIANNLKNPEAAEKLRLNIKEAIIKRSKLPKADKLYGSDKIDGLLRYKIKVQNFYVFYVVKEEEKIIEVRNFIYTRSDVSRHLDEKN